jgi:hypothetical protein
VDLASLFDLRRGRELMQIQRSDDVTLGEILAGFPTLTECAW